MSEEIYPVITEKIGTIFSEKMSAVLTMSLGTEYSLSVSKTYPIEDFLMNDSWKNFVYCGTTFTGDLAGDIYFFIDPNYGAKLADLMVMGDGNVEFNEEEHIDALQELANQSYGSLITELSNQFEKSISPDGSEAKFVDKTGIPEDAAYCCEIDFGDGNALIFVTSETVLASLEEDFAVADESPASSAISKEAILENPNLRQILNTDLNITIVYGSAVMRIADILNINPESIIELDKHGNEPVDIYVNGKIFAKGEIVVVEKNYGIVIKKIVSVKERILSLKE